MSPSVLRLFLFVAVALVAFTATRMMAAPVPEHDARQVREVIVAQLAAFARDDADAAFQTATPSVREAVGSSGMFLALVRTTYPMVYRPASVTFHEPVAHGGALLQMVVIRDEDDKTWLAAFAMERQPDASWRVRSCAVSETDWKTI